MAAALPPQLTVEQIMSSPVITIDAGATLCETQYLLERHHIHHLLVEYDGKLVGVVSDRDVLRHLSPFVGTLSERVRDANTLLRRAFQFASYHPITVERDAAVTEAAWLLLSRNISCLPVVDDESRAIGILTTRDLLRGILECPLPAGRG